MFKFDLLNRKGSLENINVLCIRDRSRDGNRDISHSLLLSLNVPDVKSLKGERNMYGFSRWIVLIVKVIFTEFGFINTEMNFYHLLTGIYTSFNKITNFTHYVSYIWSFKTCFINWFCRMSKVCGMGKEWKAEVGSALREPQCQHGPCKVRWYMCVTAHLFNLIYLSVNYLKLSSRCSFSMCWKSFFLFYYNKFHVIFLMI